jgi:hypothetical protein
MGLLIGIAIVLLIVALFPISNQASSTSGDDVPYDDDKMNTLQNEDKKFKDSHDDQA